eukprot:gene21379-biopygen22175
MSGVGAPATRARTVERGRGGARGTPVRPRPKKRPRPRPYVW